MKDSSKLRRHFGEHIDKFLFIVGSLLVALGVVVMFSDDVAIYLQQLLGLNEKHEVLKNIGYCVLGVVSIWLANKRINVMDATAKNAEAVQRQERLKNAIEHLGHKRDSVRMGGAYELFHLAKDTEDFRQTVLNILCAHIRQTTRGDEYKEKYTAEPSEEIQSLLTLIFTQEYDVFEDCSINLQNSYLNGANLSQARLKKANLKQAQLQGADLSKAQLQEAFLASAQLQKVVFIGAKLKGAKLWGAQLEDDFLIEALSQEAILSREQVDDALLIEGVREYNRGNA